LKISVIPGRSGAIERFKALVTVTSEASASLNIAGFRLFGELRASFAMC
jgi:hypothetical protein